MVDPPTLPLDLVLKISQGRVRLRRDRILQLLDARGIRGYQAIADYFGIGLATAHAAFAPDGRSRPRRPRPVSPATVTKVIARFYDEPLTDLLEVD